MKENDEASKYLTGLTWNVFQIINETLRPYILKAGCKLAPENQLLIVLVRLRLNMPFTYISMQTKLALSTTNRYFLTVLDVMYDKLKFLIHWPDRENIFQTLPPIFKANFPQKTLRTDVYLASHATTNNITEILNLSNSLSILTTLPLESHSQD